MGLTGLKATVSEIRGATRIVRTEFGRGDRGAVGTWKAELAIAGLVEGRRRELSAAINKIIGATDPADRVGDQRLHLYIQGSGLSLEKILVWSLAEFDRFLRGAGAADTELLDSPMAFRLDPLDVPTVNRSRIGLRARMTNGLLKLAPGIGAATTTAYDRALRARYGDRDFRVCGSIGGLDADSIPDFRAANPDVSFDDRLRLDIAADQVGNGIGALMLTFYQLGDLFVELPATASLDLGITPRET